jgi:hypothetical protein
MSQSNIATEIVDERKDECCTAHGELSVSEILVQPINIKRAVKDAVISGRTRGQDQKKCRTKPLPVYANLAAAVVNVSGDLTIDPDSCPVQFFFDQGPNGTATFPAGTNVGVTFPVGARKALVGRCVLDPEEDKNLCKWSFSRTSP